MPVDPVEVTTVIGKNRKATFHAFVKRLAEWWPLDTHSVGPYLGESRPETVVIETCEGGRIYEVSPDGVQRDWGKITTWMEDQEIAFTWHPGKDASFATAVRVMFSATDANETVVTLTHTGWEVLAEDAQGIRDNYQTGWTDIIQTKFADVANAAEPATR